MLVAHGRLALAIDLTIWIATVAQLPAIRFIPIDNDIALAAVGLPSPLHKDPADRLIIATARHGAIPLVTADQKIHAYPHIRTMW